MTERLSLSQYREMHKLGPVEPAPGRGTGLKRCMEVRRPEASPPSVTPEQRAVIARRSPAAGESPAAHKYCAIACDGPDGMGGVRRYPSKREARMAARLEQEREIGGIVAWLPQVSVIVGQVGGKAVRHVVDALLVLEVHPGGTFIGKFVEAKGFRHRTGERKRAALERLTGTVVEVV